MNTKKWTTKTGIKIRIKDMSDSHLLNTVKLLQRSGEYQRTATMQVYLTPFMEPMGEMAQDAFDKEFDRMLEATWRDFVPEIYWDMIAELYKRKITVPEGLDVATEAYIDLKIAGKI